MCASDKFDYSVAKVRKVTYCYKKLLAKLYIVKIYARFLNSSFWLFVKVCIFAMSIYKYLMFASLSYILHNGKNSSFMYYARNYLESLIPSAWFRRRLHKTLQSVDGREDKDYILSRVDYYCKLETPVALPPDAIHIDTYNRRCAKVYWFDSMSINRWFPSSLKWVFRHGDINYVPDVPSIVKSRPVCPGNENGVIQKLNKVRHFIFVKDKKRFSEKKDKVLFRGAIRNKGRRIAFFEQYFNHPMCDLGDVSKNFPEHEEWKVSKMTIKAQLDYKFILALEGNDVASNLKWVMSSHSIAVMPRPTCETWFMEGTLKPNFHYIEIKPDYSDLEERLQYYIDHPDEAEAIIRNANQYVEQFKDKKRELLISLLVMEKYFKMTNQI